MSEHTDWGKVWSIVKREYRPREEWPHFEYDGEIRFHIYDAHYHLTTLPKEWHILHGFGHNYEPEEWVGDPWHFMNRHSQRAPVPENFKAHAGAIIIPDYLPEPEGWRGAWHWTHPPCAAHAASIGLQWPDGQKKLAEQAAIRNR